MSNTNRNADEVRGKMKLVYEDGKIRPSRQVSFFLRYNILPTNGSLVAASIFKDYNLCFDERVMFGYEDADLFYCAHLRGVRLFLLEHLYFFGARRKIKEKDELKYLYGCETGAYGNKKISRWLASWSGLCYTVRYSIEISNYCELYFITFFRHERRQKNPKNKLSISGIS